MLTSLVYNPHKYYQENFLVKYLLTGIFTLFSSDGNKNFGKPNVCHHTKKCSKGKAQTLIGI